MEHTHRQRSIRCTVVQHLCYVQKNERKFICEHCELVIVVHFASQVKCIYTGTHQLFPTRVLAEGERVFVYRSATRYRFVVRVRYRLPPPFLLVPQYFRPCTRVVV